MALRPPPSSGSGSAVDVYSAAEVLTAKTWMGQPVYRKVVDLGALPSSALKTVAHGIAGVAQWVSVTAALRTTATPANYGGIAPLTSVVSLAEQVSIYTDGGNVNVRTAIPGWTTYSGLAVLEYTKS